MKRDITRLFCLADDFLKALEEERKKKQNCIHRFDVFERVSSEKNLQKQSFQRIGEEGNRRKVGFSDSNYTLMLREI